MIDVLAKDCLRFEIRYWQKTAQFIDRQSMKVMTRKDNI